MVATLLELAACGDASSGSGGDGVGSEAGSNGAASTSSASLDTGTAGATASGADETATSGPMPRDLGPSPRPWCDALEPDTWTEIPGTAYLDWATTGIPSGEYRGTNPLGAMVDAYGDPAVDPIDGRFYFYGGGHGDGTCNAVVGLDPGDFSYSLVGQPTPPTVYLPQYLQTTDPITYPSGEPFSGWFLSAAELPDPADAAYAAPALARVSSHMYAAAAVRNSVIHYFYLTYAEFDVLSGTWSGRDVDLGAQLVEFRPEYGDVPLQQGTVAIYDDKTDRFFVTLNAGDAGGGWRNGFIVFDPGQRKIETIHELPADAGGPMPNSPSIVKVDRRLFVFTKLGNYGEPQIMHQGFVFDLDARSFAPFVLSGDAAASTYDDENVQETIPAFFDGTSIRRWNYDPDTRSQLLQVAIEPTSGSGTAGDPFVFEQSTRTMAGEIVVDGVAPEYAVSFTYRRLVWDEYSGCAIVLPRSDSNWYALRPSE